MTELQRDLFPTEAALQAAAQARGIALPPERVADILAGARRLHAGVALLEEYLHETPPAPKDGA